MSKPQEIRRQATVLTRQLIAIALCNDQNFPTLVFLRDHRSALRMGGAQVRGIPAQDVPYEQVYNELDQARHYMVKMLDGALVQMQHEFRRDTILKHSLAFLPSPCLEEFQNSPEIYLEDSIFAEVVQPGIVPFPIRFDFDLASAQDLVHPSCHLTLGQYKNCRIPVSAPLTPFYFCDCILRNFYHTAHGEYAGRIPRYLEGFPGSITEQETAVVHIQVPRG